MKRKNRVIEKALKKKGFEQSNCHHRYLYYHTLDGQKTQIKTKTSHSNGEVSDDLLSKMKKQVRLQNINDFHRLIDCPMSQEEYEEHLIEMGYIQPISSEVEEVEIPNTPN